MRAFASPCLRDQILPGTFEYPLNHIIDNELELTIFEPPYKNDDTGAPAFDPVILLKIILPGWNDKGEGGQLYKEDDDKEDGYGRGEADIEQEDGGDRACICKYTL